MKKQNGHSNGRAKPTSRNLPGDLQASFESQPPPASAQANPGVVYAAEQPLLGQAPRDWETALAVARTALKKADARSRPSTTGLGHPAKTWQPAVSPHGAPSRILLQPTILKSVPIGDNGDVGIGLHARENGVIVQTEAWSPMQIGDVLELFWGVPSDPQSPDYPGIAAASKTLQFPEELNKPVLLTVPENDVVTGWFNVVCRVTRANTGFQESSPVLHVLVKLDRPGGIDPAPDENPNLAAPILPPDVVQNGVDATWAARGVPVIIEPYPNMALLDRIRLNWGGAFVEYTVRDGVNQPVTVTVDEATIRAAGDGDALVVRYQIFDVVGDRSGWSPSTEVMVDVQEDALFPPEVPDAFNNVIDLNQLGSDDVRVLVTAFPTAFAIGDVVTLQWMGHTAESLPVPYEEAQTVTRLPQTLEFFVPNANVAALAQGDAVVSYSLQNGRVSTQTRVTTVGDAVTLPAPSVDEASGDELDASASRATVRIPPYPTMDVGDVVTLIWSGVRADGQSHVYQATRQISGSAVGKEISLVVPTSEIALLAGGTVQVWYEVVAGDGTPLPPSQALTLRVSDTQGVLLPAPSVDEAPDNATLDPEAVDLYAEVRILPYPGMAVDDRVDMYWTGSGANGSMTDWITIRAATLNKPLLFDVDKAYVDANDGGTVTVRYTVTPKGGRPRSSTPLTLRVGAALSLPIITSITDSQGEIPDHGITHDTTVTIRGTALADMTVEVFDNDTVSYGVVPVNDVGVWTHTVTQLADGSHRFTAKGLYGNEPVSPARSFKVELPVALAPPIVTEADSLTNTLNLIKPINGAHVVIDYASMAIDDIVTMIWKGTEGAGSQQQAVKVETVGPINFAVGDTVITPNYNKTVRIYYTVKRAGESSATESLSLDLLIQNIALVGSAQFYGSNTSFFRCTARSTISIPDDLPIGSVIETTPPSGPSGYTGITGSTNMSHYRINLVGAEPKDDSNLYPSGIPGVAYRLNHGYSSPPQAALAVGPVSATGGTPWGNPNSWGAIVLVKTGPIASGATLKAGVLAEWRLGSNRLYYMGYQLMNDVTFNVLKRRSISS